MGYFSKVNLLISTLVVILVSLVYSIEEPDDSVITHISSTSPFDFSVFNGYQLGNHTVHLQLTDEEQPPIVEKQSVTKKKKLKRFVPVFWEINSPVKEIAPAVFNILRKNNYSKPYFLSHIHQFLFRLTLF